MLAKDKLYTIEEFERILADPANEDRLLELIDGKIVEKVPTQKHSGIVLRLAAEMMAHANNHKLGIVSIETRHQLPGDKGNSYIPDASVISGQSEEIEEGAVPQMPDLTVEVQSSGQNIESILKKINSYFDKGSKMAWLFLTDETVKVLRPGRETITLTIDDTLDGEDILHGFKMSIREIYRLKT